MDRIFHAILERRLQGAINSVSNCALNHRYTFTLNKSYDSHFHRKRSIQPLLQVILRGRPIIAKNNVRFLGKNLNEKLKRKNHIKQLKRDCMLHTSGHRVQTELQNFLKHTRGMGRLE